MADEPTWDDIFQPARDGAQPPVKPATPAATPPPATDGQSIAAAPVADADAVAADEPYTPYSPPTRRELRESEARAKARDSGKAVKPRKSSKASKPVKEPRQKRGREGDLPPKPPRVKRRRRFVWLWVLLAFLLAIGGTAYYAWLNYEEPIRKILGIELPNDYEGTGNGEETTITVVSGDIGSDIATKLTDAGVTMTYDAFYDLLLAQTTAPQFLPGTFTLQKEMSAQSALDVLVDPANIVVSRVLVREGVTLPQALSALSEGTGVPLADFEAAAEDYVALGVPADAPSLEGFLFPATYEFEPGLTAQQILQRMVDRMFQSLDAAGVAPDDRLEVLTMAALIQKEGGSTEDFYKVARVFQNRLDQDMLLQSDATVSYGSGGTSILTTDEERADASNPYNTYVHKGLPVGPISAPGDDAIDAALHPADGDWLYFVLVNGETGETKFSSTIAEHEAAVLEWQAWYRAHPDFDN